MPVEATDAINLVVALSTWGRTKISELKGQESIKKLNFENKTLRKIDSLQNIISHLKLESIEEDYKSFSELIIVPSYSDLGPNRLFL